MDQSDAGGSGLDGSEDRRRRGRRRRADGDFASAAGYPRLEFFSFTGPSLFLVAGIAVAAGTLAGEEEHGVLTLVLDLRC